MRRSLPDLEENTLPLTHFASIGDLQSCQRLLAEAEDVAGEVTDETEIASMTMLSLSDEPWRRRRLVNQRNGDSTTALMVAAGWGHATVTKLLLDAGARVGKKTSPDGWDALIFAVSAGSVEVRCKVRSSSMPIF